MIRFALIPLLFLSTGVAQAADIPDLTGNYDAGTLTPLNRSPAFGDKQFMTREEGKAIETNSQALFAGSLKTSDPNRTAPVKGGDGNNAYGAGSVGGYNAFWVDPGSDAFEIDGKFRTSIVYDPPNGRQPSMTMKGMMKMAKNFASFAYNNDGTASWLKKKGTGPFDGPETLSLAERCLLGFSAGPPMLPGLYNNFKKIVQTEHHVVILLEMVHDARIIRLDSEHAPQTYRKWLGDSIGRWEGDTLVVDTTNFREDTGLYGGDENLHLTERFSLLEDGNLLYKFTVEDPTIWTASWSGEYVWKKSPERVYEYACHEGNYAMGNILRGARILEKEFTDQAGGSE
ncbi:MAG: hypothetical protein QGI68_17275 [Pseudomonadales bacterium]|jgi:hypothetical protein|nr:hypothetical protein [Pseudomonadales bacterium]MDP7597296.1 hypothetical protein [Pseudomonadales bacterium]HJN49788.1 hypothetical protein [Pseudomonadales bacterium]|tara:strand:- start:1585 stop:2613 length:1029 start_codon:yes stop_codon:yes gene_type:complete